MTVCVVLARKLSGITVARAHWQLKRNPLAPQPPQNESLPELLQGLREAPRAVRRLWRVKLSETQNSSQREPPKLSECNNMELISSLSELVCNVRHASQESLERRA